MPPFTDAKQIADGVSAVAIVEVLRAYLSSFFPFLRIF